MKVSSQQIFDSAEAEVSSRARRPLGPQRGRGRHRDVRGRAEVRFVSNKQMKCHEEFSQAPECWKDAGRWRV